MELAAISALKELQALYGGGVKDGAPGEGHASDHEALLGAAATAAAAAKGARGTGTDPTPREVEALLARLLDAQPSMGQATLLDEAGFPPRAVSMLLAKVGGADRRTVATALSEYLDGEAFEEFSEALEEVIAGKRRESFTWQAVQKTDTVWWEAAMALLASPKVRLTSPGRTMAGFAGLGPLMEMEKVAKRGRKVTHHHQQGDQQKRSRTFSTVAKLSPHVTQQVSSALAEVFRYEKVLTHALREGTHRLVRNVDRIVRATLIMQEGQERHECDLTAGAEGVLVNPNWNGPSGGKAIELGDADVDESLIKMGHEAGLPKPKRGYRYMPGDIVSGNYKFGGMTRGLFGTLGDIVKGEATPGAFYSLQIEYNEIPTASGGAEAVCERVKFLADRLEAAGVVKLMHKEDGAFTWYKLNEWMQVEIFEVFAGSMNTEPWYC